MRAYKGFIQCAGALPSGLCTQSVLLRTVRVSRALCGASLQRLHTVCWCSTLRTLHPVSASVYGTSLKGFVRCEPTKALYSVLVLSPQGFAPSQCLCARAVSEQMSSCTRTCTYVRYELTQMSSCTGTCMSVRCEPTTALCSFPPESARIADRSIHVEPVRLRVLCENRQFRNI